MFKKQERIYYEDTDAGGIVYHANYLKFMERCRCEWLSTLGFDVATLHDTQQIMFVVREANVKYVLPARLFDDITVTAQALQVGKVKLLLEQKIYNNNELLCVGTIKLAALDTASSALAPMPAALVSALQTGGDTQTKTEI